MTQKEILEYGKTISIEDYVNGLQAHPYIPQSDRCIADLIKKHLADKEKSKVLDLGCGPARLTTSIAGENQNHEFIGIDSSPEFLNNAILHRGNITGNNTFLVLDHFEDIAMSTGSNIVLNPDNPFQVIFMQGVWHHIHGETRHTWLEKIKTLLADDGILIIGDEYIPDYEDEGERKLFLVRFYAHIIGEAIRGGFSVLAEEEAKNLVDDVTAGGEGAGMMDGLLLSTIFKHSTEINNTMFHNINHMAGLTKSERLLSIILGETRLLEKEGSRDSFYRGDFKVSMTENIKEMESFGFSLKEKFTFGPTNHIGGMGVIVFNK